MKTGDTTAIGYAPRRERKSSSRGAVGPVLSKNMRSCCTKSLGLLGLTAFGAAQN